MNIEQKSNLKRSLIGFSILTMMGAIPLASIGIHSFYENQPVNQMVTAKAPRVEVISAVVPDIKYENITVPRTIIVVKRSVNKNIVKQKKKIWVCKAPRDLEQGSGQVKECEWK